MDKCNELVTSDVQLILRNLLDKIDVQNYTISLSPGSKKGDNFLGKIAKVKIRGYDGTGKNIVLNFIIKSAPRNKTYREALPVRLAYDREIYAYNTVLPEFDAHQKEKKVHDPFKSFAKYYESSMNYMNEALILEDMKELGYELHNTKEPLNYKHALFVIKEYAKFHALSFALRINKPKIFNNIAKNTQENIFNRDGLNLHEFIYEQSKKVLLLIDSVKEKTLYEKFKKFQNEMEGHIKNILKSDLTNPYFVICHGDCWINNFLFQYNSPVDHQSPKAVCILDWQLARYGSVALDLSYFIFTSTDREMREKHYDNLIETYYNTFASFLKELGGDPEKQFSFDMFQQHLKKYSAFGLYSSIMSLLIMVSDSEEVPDIHNFAENEDVLKTFSYESKNVELYNNRMKGVIIDFERLGYEF